MKNYNVKTNQIKYSSDVWAYTWNAENRMSSATNTDDGTYVTYKYDYQGRMFEKVTNVSTNHFIWNGNHIVAEITDSSTNLYVWSQGETLTASLDGETVFYCHDANKNVTDLVNDTGDSVAHYEYSPFGGITEQSGALAEDNPFRFSNEYWDDDIKKVVYLFRVYDPWLGKFLSLDPMEEFGGLNLSAICGNDCINGTDYLGLWTVDGVLKIICCEKDDWVIDQIKQKNIVIMKFDKAANFWHMFITDTIVEEDLSRKLSGNTKYNKKKSKFEIRINSILSDRQAASTLYHESEHINLDVFKMTSLDEEVEVRIRTENFRIFHGLPETKVGYRKSITNRQNQEVIVPDEEFIEDDIYGSSHYNPRGKKLKKRTYDGVVGGGTVVNGTWSCDKFKETGK